MPIEFNCNQCGRLLRTPDGTAGRRSKCPACGTIQPIPEAGASADDAVVEEPDPSGSPPVESSAPPPRNAPGEEVDRPFGETLPYRGEDTPTDRPGGSPFAQAGVPDTPPVGSPDPENPYQAPSEFGVDVQPTYHAGTLQATKVDIGDVLSRAWELFKPQWLMCALVLLVNTILTTIFTYGLLGIVMGFRFGGGDPIIAQFLEFGTNILTQFFNAWLWLGMTIFMLRVARGQPAQIMDLFMGGRYWLTMILSMICFGALLVAILAVIGIPAGIIGGLVGVFAGGGMGVGVGLAVFFPIAVIAMFYFVLMLSQFFFAIVDRNAGPVEALLMSRQITRGNKLVMFLLYLLAIPLTFIGILACCVGYLPAMGYLWLAWTVQYLIMTGQPTGGQGLPSAAV